MNHKLFTTLSGLSVTSTLLVIGMMTPGQAARPPAATNDSPMARTLDPDAAIGTGDVAAPIERKQRRHRTSLSMPYFSFAQSLRPRG